MRDVGAEAPTPYSGFLTLKGDGMTGERAKSGSLGCAPLEDRGNRVDDRNAAGATPMM